MKTDSLMDMSATLMAQAMSNRRDADLPSLFDLPVPDSIKGVELRTDYYYGYREVIGGEWVYELPAEREPQKYVSGALKLTNTSNKFTGFSKYVSAHR